MKKFILLLVLFFNLIPYIDRNTVTFIGVSAVHAQDNGGEKKEKEHTKGKRKSTKQKHTKRRPGKVYDKNQNAKRGAKNKKHQNQPNPNTKQYVRAHPDEYNSEQSTWEIPDWVIGVGHFIGEVIVILGVILIVIAIIAGVIILSPVGI
jgi:hypothetical protein